MQGADFIIIKASKRKIKIIGIILVSLIVLLTSLTYAYGKINMSAAVAGWFTTEQIDNTNLSITTNMTVWVNGTQFIKCENYKNLNAEDIYNSY